jgi:hypothetical protein
MIISPPICCRPSTVAARGLNMVDTIAKSAGENNAREVNCGQIRGEQVTAGKDRD